MVPGPGFCSCHSPHLATSSLASLCFLVYRLGLTALFLWDQVLMEEKSLVQGLAYIQQALKDKQAIKTRRRYLVKFHPSLKDALPASSSTEPFMKRNGILLFPRIPSFFLSSFLLFLSPLPLPLTLLLLLHYPYETYYLGLGITVIHIQGPFPTYENTHS